METVVKRYDAKLDSKKRITIRGSGDDYYHVHEFNDGPLILKPRIFMDPNELSENTLRMMDKSVENFKKGNVSDSINLDKYLKLAKELDEV